MYQMNAADTNSTSGWSHSQALAKECTQKRWFVTVCWALHVISLSACHTLRWQACCWQAKMAKTTDVGIQPHETLNDAGRQMAKLMQYWMYLQRLLGGKNSLGDQNHLSGHLSGQKLLKSGGQKRKCIEGNNQSLQGKGRDVRISRWDDKQADSMPLDEGDSAIAAAQTPGFSIGSSMNLRNICAIAYRIHQYIWLATECIMKPLHPSHWVNPHWKNGLPWHWP